MLTRIAILCFAITYLSACAIFSARDVRLKTESEPPLKTPLVRKPPHHVCPLIAHSYYLNDQRLWVREHNPNHPDVEEYGIASWYGKPFHGRTTANGERYNMYAPTAAHKFLPLGTYVEVTNLNNGLRTIVRINDRGPFIDDRIIDLSFGAANHIGMVVSGIAPIRLLVILSPNK